MSPAALSYEPTHTTSIGGLQLPEYIGPLEFIGEHSGPEGALSATYSYRAVGLALEISVTDLGDGQVADGVDAPELLSRYERAKQEITASRPERHLEFREEKRVPLGPRSSRMAREALFSVGEPGEQASSYIIFTAAHGLVIDARFDVAPGLEEDGVLSRGEILEALGKAIPDSPAPVVAARARVKAEAEAAGRIAIVWDPATPQQESTLWLAYLYARAAYAVSAANADFTVGEREASFEEEVRGRSTAVNMFRALRYNDAQPASDYFSDIDRVEAAGFLREYVWSYLRRESWGPAPAGLDLAGFEAWRRIHLKDHVPVTHGKIRIRTAAIHGARVPEG
jgi:hypothetical protein